VPFQEKANAHAALSDDADAADVKGAGA